MLLVPAIDISEGRCVRLYQGDFAQVTRYALTPTILLRRYDAWGVSWVHVVDLDGARFGLRSHHSLICALTQLTSVRLQVGGGVRSRSDVEMLLKAGVSRVVVGSSALERPCEVNGWLDEFGAERICLAFDFRKARVLREVRTHGWKHAAGVSLWEALAPYGSSARHILCTDIARDGTLFGPNLDLYQEAIRSFPQFSWQASGGIRSAADLQTLSEIKVEAAISGKALLEERILLEELKPFLPAASFPVSTSATATS